MLLSFGPQGPLQHHWYAVATSENVQQGPVAIELLREQLVLWRGASGRITAAPDKCPHRGHAMSLGIVDDGCLVCPSHAWRFDEAGRCVDHPRRDAIDESAHLATLGCEERHGLVWVCLGDPRTEIPTVAVGDDPAQRRANTAPATWIAPAPRIVEALLAQGFADGSEPGFDLPFTYRRSIPNGDGADALLMVTCCPVGAGRSLVFPVLWSNGAATSSDDLLQAEVAALTTMQPDVEAVHGMYEIDEDPPEDSADPGSTWRRAFHEAVVARV